MADDDLFPKWTISDNCSVSVGIGDFVTDMIKLFKDLRDEFVDTETALERECHYFVQLVYACEDDALYPILGEDEHMVELVIVLATARKDLLKDNEVSRRLLKDVLNFDSFFEDNMHSTVIKGYCRERRSGTDALKVQINLI